MFIQVLVFLWVDSQNAFIQLLDKILRIYSELWIYDFSMNTVIELPFTLKPIHTFLETLCFRINS